MFAVQFLLEYCGTNYERSNDMSKWNFDLKKNVLFIRLAETEDILGEAIDGFQTITAYQNEIVKSGYTWFGTDSLNPGISRKKLPVLINCLRSGRIKIVFVISKAGNGNNSVSYSAEISDIISNAEKTVINTNIPPIFWGQAFKIWLRLDNLQPETILTTSNLIVMSSRNYLNRSIENSRYHFGYLEIV